MGVHGLWDLLSPVGRRVSVETLSGKRLAIDASIWMVQFMKAMRDERGEMVRNAHILGFFRRICKLLFLRTKPVFVFDGATPALKRRTVIARRRQRENAQAKIRKTAEKLLLNHLKAMRLKELANDLENQRKSNADKGKRVITDQDESSGTTSKTDPPDTTKIDQEALDAMLAASIEAEEEEGFIGEASTSGAGVLEEDEDDDEEMLLPTLHGKVDPAVLASLPPSMQLDLLGQMRERLMAENRQKYQKVKKAPARFSELQIESYLKTVAFRREINVVQKAAGGRGIDGVQTSRIASEANREYIFSSSFTGNRQSLASIGKEANSQNGSTIKSNGIFESFINEPKKAFHEDVETYRDERGRVRMSKMKAMGIQMTRDLQRNLDLMKEIEQDKINDESSKLPEGSNKTNHESIPISGISIEVSLEDDNQQQFVDSYDDVFAQFVADNNNNNNSESGPRESDESDVEWEEGPSGNNPEPGPHGPHETVSKGELLEEADFQEAIRRSMEEINCQKDEIKDDENMDIEVSFAPKLPDKLFVDVDEIKVNELELTTSNDPDEISTEAEIDDLNEMSEDNCKGDTETIETNISDLPDDVMPDVTIDDSQQCEEVNSPVIDHIPDTLEPNETMVKESKPVFDVAQNVTEERESNTFYEQKEDDVSNFVPTDMSEEQINITKANLEQEITNLATERNELGDEQRRLERNAESVSGEMFAECQELLQMFGLPYIIAPMEAEAQCAYMELQNLVDGVVTDDSDVLLFGARSVHKNIFDDRKYVETYFMKDIESELGLTRDKLIRMAMLLGSDYTEGISGIGIVNAVEVLNAFPEENGLQKFREWIESPDPNILGLSTKKKGLNTVGESVSKSDDEISNMKQIFMDKHRNVSKNWHIPSTFPSDAVISAYASPQVDKSTEPFSWGKPDLFVLRKLCCEKFGWGTQKADELLQPVLKEYNKHETQLRLEAFYTFNERFAKIRSKRISKAVKGIAGTQIDSSNAKKRKKINHEETKNDIENDEQLTVPNESIQEGTKTTKKRSNVTDRGRGKGQTVGRGRGRGKKKNNLELSGTSSDDGENTSLVHAQHTHVVRKSKRVRKPVISTNIEDSETDEEPKTQQNHAEVVGNEETSVSNDLKSPLSGNGVNPDDAELDKDLYQKDENAPEAELTKEYLFMGGGFCLEEDEGNKEPGISPPPTDGLNDDGLDEGAHRGGPEPSISPNVATDLATILPQRNNEEDGDGVRPMSFLSAMPNLKRKRKKV